MHKLTRENRDWTIWSIPIFGHDDVQSWRSNDSCIQDPGLSVGERVELAPQWADATWSYGSYGWFLETTGKYPWRSIKKMVNYNDQNLWFGPDP